MDRRAVSLVSGLLCLCAAAGGAFGQTASSSPPPAPAAGAMADGICTDRPTKTNFACVADTGHFQYEADVVNASFLRLDGVTTDTTLIVNPTFKYGLAKDIDIEANIAAGEIVRTHDSGTGHDQTLGGVGDLYLRLKYEFLNTAGGTFQVALLPYVKLPTARLGVGDGALEEGLITPVNIKLGGPFTLTLDPEVDLLKDSIGEGRHPNTAQLINLGIALPNNLTLYGELWGDWNFDPRGLIRQYSADTSLAWGVTARLQLDIGVNVGLNRTTPGAQVYLGVSQKF